MRLQVDVEGLVDQALEVVEVGARLPELLIEAPVQQASNAVQYQATPANALPQVDTTTGLPK